jgi:putative membrane protein
MIATVLVIFVSMIHALIAIIEMCFWHLPKPHSRLGVDAETAKQVAPVVANAGLYSGFIAAGLLFCLYSWGNLHAILFLLSCVSFAAVYGAFTLMSTTLVLQTLPGLLAEWEVWAEVGSNESR